MSRIPAALFLLAINGWGQNCFKYETPITLTGTLALIDEAGYNDFIALQPAQPLCVIDPAGTAYPPEEKNVILIQVGPPRGPNVDGAARWERLERLAGHRVSIHGELWHQFTGYHRTKVLMDVQRIDPLDPDGEAALHSVKPPVKLKDVSSYEITVNAGPRLVLEARESKSNALLVPVEAYAPHWMTGGEVVYVDCRDGYELTNLSAAPKGAICPVGCGVNAFPKKPTVLHLRCTKLN